MKTGGGGGCGGGGGGGGSGGGDPVLYPRSERGFFNGLLAGRRLWQRPPHDHCNRCADFTLKSDRVCKLTAALLESPRSLANKELINEAGGDIEAWSEVRRLQNTLPELRKHVTWRDDQRTYLTGREKSLGSDGLLLQLDYGGFTDSRGSKISCYSVTVLAKGQKQRNIDFFFDASNAKKDGKTGIFFLRELLSPTAEGAANGVSLLKQLYPNATHLILSGDTGNGYRAYEMLDELSTVHSKYGLTVELIPLAPGHAWNRTDARIAHMNTFLRKIKRRSRVFGAEAVAALFHKATDVETSRRAFMVRSHVFFRIVEQGDAAVSRESMGARVESDFLHGGRVGVKGLLYFAFSFEGEGGVRTHPPGYARVREHGDPDKPSNRTFVYTWRKEEAKLLCQTCSDKAVSDIPTTIAIPYPAQASEHGCTQQSHLCSFPL